MKLHAKIFTDLQEVTTFVMFLIACLALLAGDLQCRFTSVLGNSMYSDKIILLKNCKFNADIYIVKNVESFVQRH